LSLFPSIPPAPPESSSLSLHDALPILSLMVTAMTDLGTCRATVQPTTLRTNLGTENQSPTIPPAMTPPTAQMAIAVPNSVARLRSEEHTSELQSRFDLVCRLLLENKK